MPELIVAINNLNQNLKMMMGLVDFVLLAVIVDFVLDIALVVVWFFAQDYNLNRSLKMMMGLVDFVLLAVIVDFVLDLVLVVWLFARVLDLPLAVK